ncbi:hypothetical protein ACFTWS_39770 [Streptomyces sp. NPDC057027]|uniref:hypothetical protein n=1 Tax=Streptomyces sp. NPDC057027 TaxID=3346004 RepID=UPI003630C118
MVLDVAQRGEHHGGQAWGVADGDQMHTGALAQGEQTRERLGAEQVGAQNDQPGCGQRKDPRRGGRALSALMAWQLGRLAQGREDVEGERLVARGGGRDER